MKLKLLDILIDFAKEFLLYFPVAFKWFIVIVLPVFPCSGEGIVFTLDELTGALVVSHKLIVSSRDFPGTHYDLIVDLKMDYVNLSENDQVCKFIAHH